MKKILLFLALILNVCHVLAQDVSVDKKSGLVQVNGKPAFYLTERNRILFDVDFSLENLQHVELAYLKLIKTKQWNPSTRTYDDVSFYTVTFTRTRDFCELHNINSFALKKSLAKNIAAASLVVDGEISDAAEQKFIVIHNGVFFNDPNSAPPPVVVNVNGDNHDRDHGNNAPPPDININGKRIYNGDVYIGSYDKSDNPRLLTVSVYNARDIKVVTASHTSNTDNDWAVTIVADQNVIQLRYHADSPLVRLFSFLVEQGYL